MRYYTFDYHYGGIIEDFLIQFKSTPTPRELHNSLSETEDEVNCRLCNSRISNPFSEAELLGHNIKYFECAQCEYIPTEEPFWLADAYALNKFE